MEKQQHPRDGDGARQASQVTQPADTALQPAGIKSDVRSNADEVSENELRDAERNVREAEAATERQRLRVFEQRRNGKDTREAEILLRTCQNIVLQHRKYLAMQQIRYRRAWKSQPSTNSESLPERDRSYLAVGK
jgi:hypothetical protein